MVSRIFVKIDYKSVSARNGVTKLTISEERGDEADYHQRILGYDNITQTNKLNIFFVNEFHPRIVTSQIVITYINSIYFSRSKI
jgi:hypothetical protein